jgi:RHS repeat-associated protein
LLKVIDFYGNSTVLTYNNIGMKLTSTDPDLGFWQYSYYPLGELKTQTDANGNVTTFTYDDLSRLLTRVEPLETTTTPTGTTTFTYDVGNKAIGKLTSASSPAMSGAAYGYSESYSFDNYGRPSAVDINADNVSYNYSYSYNAAGLQDTLTYPTSSSGFRFKLRYSYDYGQLKAINSYTGDVLGTTFWQAQGMNARGQVILEDYGSGLSTSTGYDRVTGKIEDRTTGPSAGTTIQNLSYQWDALDNLTQRQDLRTGVTETFTYDALDRLYTANRNGSALLTMGYDAIGNITSKTGVGTYTYHATKKHAVVSTTGTINNTYGYDANGNMTSRNGYTTTWYSSNLPHTINGNGMTARFWYGPTGKRWKQQKALGTKVETWTYIGPYVERLVTSTVNEFRHYVYAPTGPVLVYKRNSAGTSSITTYLTTDHLGSTDVITSSGGTQLVNASFNPWGERKAADGISTPTATEDTTYGNTTLRGFTFHEVLEDLKLVNMNGRVYDPSIGRFMSADPFVQAPFNSQSLNRYSYVFNNPLSLTDPSGFQSTADGGGSYNGGGGGTWVSFIGIVFSQREPHPDFRDQRAFGGMHFPTAQCTLTRRDNCYSFNYGNPREIIRPYNPPPGRATDEMRRLPVPVQNVVPAMPTDQITTVSTVGGSWSAWNLLGVSAAEAADAQGLFDRLWSGYPSKKPYVDPKTGRPPPGYRDQCAIQLSVAFHNAGIDMKSFGGSGVIRLHGNRTAIRAQEFADWLKRTSIDGVGRPEVITGADWADRIEDRTGVVFFGDYWLRADGQRTGDHIDLWNGSRMTSWSSWIRVQAGLHLDGLWSDYGRSKTIIFWPVE